MKNCFRALHAIISVLVIVSCGNKDTFHKGADSFVDLLTANYRVADVLIENIESTPVDILWVIDNSGSMSEYQNAVKANMSLFMQRLTATRDLDWRMALLSTDTANTPYLGMGTAGSFDYLNSNPVSLFNSAVSRLGTGGSGREKAITPIMNAVSRYPSFFRADSVLAIFIVTDAPEQSTESVSQLMSLLGGLKSDPKQVVTYGAFGARDLACQTSDDQWNYQGSKYQQLVSANGGKYFPLCSQTFGTDMASIADNISVRTQSAKLVLPVPADVASIEVTYQGVKLAEVGEANAVWRYNAYAHAVEIFDVSKLTNPEGQIRVTFLRAK